MNFKKGVVVATLVLSSAAFAEIDLSQFDGLSDDQVFDRAEEIYLQMDKEKGDQEIEQGQISEEDKNRPRRRYRRNRRHYRGGYMCLTRDRSGRRYMGRDRNYYSARRESLRRCFRNSFVPRSCRLIRCRRSGWGGHGWGGRH